METAPLLASEFVPFVELLRRNAAEHPDSIAISDSRGALTWRAFDDRIDRIAARLLERGVGEGDTIALLGYNAVGYVLAFCAALRIGAVAVPLTSSATPTAIAAMIADCGAAHLFLDRAAGESLSGVDLASAIERIAFDDSHAGTPIREWMAPAGARPQPIAIDPDAPFNVIYSSGTTGMPKGIVQSHGMRAGHIRRAMASGYDENAVTLISTPLYSNTTLVSLIPALAGGGRVVLMEKFDARRFLETAVAEKVTHAMLVPAQYQRLMALPDFDAFDLSRFRYKSCTSAPFSAALKRDIVRRWPGQLVEVYGMTEGGGTCLLSATEYPDKLHTVGQPAPGHDIRLIDPDGKEVPRGAVGEVVGRSEMMMTGYRNRQDATRQAEWRDAEGRRFIRHGDIGRFDEDGFLILMDRAKDMIISGGFNVYPSDLEAELIREPEVAEAAVVGVPSELWGETPVAFVVLRDATAEPQSILSSVNARLGRTQRISAIHSLDELPRSAIGKVLKRELRERIHTTS